MATASTTTSTKWRECVERFATAIEAHCLTVFLTEGRVVALGSCWNRATLGAEAMGMLTGRVWRRWLMTSETAMTADAATEAEDLVATLRAWLGRVADGSETERPLQRMFSLDECEAFPNGAAVRERAKLRVMLFAKEAARVRAE